MLVDINEMKQFIEEEFLGEAVVISPSMIKRSPRGKNFIAVDSNGQLVADDLTDKAFKSGDLVNYNLVADGETEIEILGQTEPVIARLVHKVDKDGVPVYVEGTEPEEIPEEEEDYYVVTKKTGKMVRANTGRKATRFEQSKVPSVSTTDKKTLTPAQKEIIDNKKTTSKKIVVDVEEDDEPKLPAQKLKELRYQILNAIRSHSLDSEFLKDFMVVTDKEAKIANGIKTDLIFAFESKQGNAKFLVKGVIRTGITKADWKYNKRDIDLKDVLDFE